DATAPDAMASSDPANSTRRAADAHRDFRVGRILAASIRLLPRNVLKFIPLTAIGALPGLWFYYEMTDEFGLRVGAVAVAALFLGFVLGSICEGPILYGTFRAMRGAPVSLGQSLSKGLSRFLPIGALAVCAALALTVGFILLIVPGFILLAMWFVAIPACVVERL